MATVRRRAFTGEEGFRQCGHKDGEYEWPRLQRRHGRYLESDPIGNVDGPNTYLYAKADPILLSDGFGLTGLTSDGDCCLRSQALGQK